MKKNNKTLRVAAVLAVGALLSTCLVSGTFAKYTTKNESSDSARVAKFGVTVTGDKTMFSNTYGATVVSDDQADVVAPGTDGTLTANDITGTPEVSVHVDNTGEFTLTGDWKSKDGTKFYCPIVVTVAGNEISGLDYANATAFQDAVNDAINKTSNDYAPGVAITSAGTAVSWKWAFNGGAAGKSAAQNDDDDTYLGDQATAGQASGLSLKVTTTVTQID